METHCTVASAGKGKRFQVLIGAILVQLILGTVYGYSIFWEPLTSNIFPPIITEAQQTFQINDGTFVEDTIVVADTTAVKIELAKQQGILKYAFSICILSFAAVMVIAGRVQDIQGPRVPAIIGGLLMGSGFIYAGLMTNAIVFYLAHAFFAGIVTLLILMLFHTFFGHAHEESVIVRYAPMGIMTTCIVASVMLGNQYVGKVAEMDRLLLLWGTIGFMAGAGIGFAYVCPIAALMKWFPDHKGLVSGIAVAGFGLGAYLFSQKWGALGYIGKQGIFPFFIIHGIICIVGVTAGALLLSNPPSTHPAAKKTALADSKWQQTLKDPAFYLLWLMFFSGAMAGLMVIGIIKVFAGEQLVSAAMETGAALNASEISALMLKGSLAVGLLAIFNAVGRIVWGFISDRIGRTAAFVAMFLLQAGIMFFLAGMKTEASLSIGAALVGFNFGGNFALFPSATADFFGAKNLGANYGWVFTSYGIAGVVGIAAGNFAKVMTGSYAAAFTLAAILCLLSAGLAIVLQVLQKKKAAIEG
ncbi:nitrate/nitrite transporter [Desulfocapsa sulfexigens DSM 10523]|uniref:Nitrate/nitrite transporter n=1 Tax=Desulfocapsa sulfexigens (strain DSM 10523 / SB164P1) TaxID=1167006 RepID=M1PB71_DESSD|nr:OFA family MFS transporter [Desulfocapsa sulfexigens]AGF78892.1 nitrate/nitrite transporter [Desulfocapsa sulfexigens DSM 10523]